MENNSKLVKDILSIYNTILENKTMLEVTDVYDNIDFKDGVIPNSYPSRDNINTTLLQDIQTAAKSAGVKVDVTTAISGHESLPSRHPEGNAVDIAIINGKSVSLSNRADADKLVNALVQMGYTKNAEGSSNPKSVLTFGFPKHDNHVHVSNTTKSSSETQPGTQETQGTTSTPKKMSTFVSNAPEDKWLPFYFLGKEISPLFTKKSMTEEKNFGKDASNRYGRIILPKESNKRIKSVISGEIYNKKYSSSCVNQVTIKNEKNKIILQYCGITNPSVRDGQKVSVGDNLGTTNQDIEVTMYDLSWNRINITDRTVEKYKDDEDDLYKEKNSKLVTKKDDESRKSYQDPLTAMIVSLPGKVIKKVFSDRYDEKTGEKKEKRWGGVADKEPVDPWLLDLIKSPFKKKVKEDVERIKKLL